MASVLEQAKALIRIAVYLCIAYFVIRLWQDPYGSARSTMGFLESVGHFFAAVINKLGKFVNGLTQ